MPMKPIQTPSAPIEPREDSAHHLVETWTLDCTRWNKATDKLITLSFAIIDSVQIGHLPNVFFSFDS